MDKKYVLRFWIQLMIFTIVDVCTLLMVKNGWLTDHGILCSELSSVCTWISIVTTPLYVYAFWFEKRYAILCKRRQIPYSFLDATNVICKHNEQFPKLLPSERIHFIERFEQEIK